MRGSFVLMKAMKKKLFAYHHRTIDYPFDFLSNLAMDMNLSCHQGDLVKLVGPLCFQRGGSTKTNKKYDRGCASPGCEFVWRWNGRRNQQQSLQGATFQTKLSINPVACLKKKERERNKLNEIAKHIKIQNLLVNK